MNLKKSFQIESENGTVKYPNITVEVVDPDEIQKLWDQLDKKYSFF